VSAARSREVHGQRCIRSRGAATRNGVSTRAARFVGLVTASVLLGAPASPRSASTRDCAGRELLAATSRLSKLDCHARTARRGRAVDPACLARHDRAANATWTRLVSRSGCRVRREDDVPGQLADGFVALTAAALTGILREKPAGGPCAVVKLESLRSASSEAMRCAGANPGWRTASACVAAARARIGQRFRDAEFHIGCATIGDAPRVSARLASLVDDGVAATLPAVSFAGKVQPIFSTRCAYGGCHAAPTPSLGLDLSTGHAWSHLVGVPSVGCGALLVDSDHPTESILLAKLDPSFTGEQCVDEEPMPPGATLSTAEMALIASWVLHGGQLN